MKYSFKIIISLVLIIFCFSCNNETKNKAFIEKLATIENNSLSPYFSFHLYFKTDNDKIFESNVDGLYEIYKNSHSKNDKDFKAYLERLFDQKEVIKMKDLKKFENGNKFFNIYHIEQNIDSMTIEEIEKKYLELEKDSFTFIPKKLNSNEVATVLYKMFKDGYVVINSSDLVGYYSIAKYSENNFK